MILRINSPKDKEAVKAYVEKLPDKPFIVTIEKKKEVRSIPQNKLYWSWIKCISNETGNDNKDLHEYFSERFLRRETAVIFGVMVERAISTTKLSTVEFTAYLEKIEQFASSELGIILPHPEDLYWNEFYDKYNGDGMS